MSLMSQILVQVIEPIGGLYIFTFILRFYLQLVRADFYNQLSQAIVKVTNPLLIPVRRIIPGVFGIDIASVLVALILQIAIGELLYFVVTQTVYNPIAAIPFAILGFINLSIYLAYGALIVLVISSFVAPYSSNPFVVLARQLMNPLLRPIQNIVPPIGGLDLSVFFLFIGIGIFNTIVDWVAAQLITQKGQLLLVIGY